MTVWVMPSPDSQVVMTATQFRRFRLGVRHRFGGSQSLAAGDGRELEFWSHVRVTELGTGAVRVEFYGRSEATSGD